MAEDWAGRREFVDTLFNLRVSRLKEIS